MTRGRLNGQINMVWVACYAALVSSATIGALLLALECDRWTCDVLLLPPM